MTYPHTILAALAGAVKMLSSVYSTDTDDLMLLLHHRPRIHADGVYFYAGKWFIPIHTIYSILNVPQLIIMLEVCCVTGCDTTTFFYFEGMKKPLMLVEQKAVPYQDHTTLYFKEFGLVWIYSFISITYG